MEPGHSDRVFWDFAGCVEALGTNFIHFVFKTGLLSVSLPPKRPDNDAGVCEDALKIRSLNLAVAILLS